MIVSSVAQRTPVGDTATLLRLFDMDKHLSLADAVRAQAAIDVKLKLRAQEVIDRQARADAEPANR